MTTWALLTWSALGVAALVAYAYAFDEVRTHRLAYAAVEAAEAAACRAKAPGANSQSEYLEAIGNYRRALRFLRASDVEQVIQIRRRMARLYECAGDTPRAASELQELLYDAERLGALSGILDEIRNELGAAHYHNAMALRLQEADNASWIREADKARQEFRALAQRTSNADERRTDYLKNLSNAVRLVRSETSGKSGLRFPRNATEAKDCKNKLRLEDERQERQNRRERGEQPKEDKSDRSEVTQEESRAATSGERKK